MPEDCFYTLLRMPDVLTKTETEILDEEEWLVVREAVKEALKNAMNAIVYTDSDAESYEAYKSVQTIVAFMEDSFFLDERQSSKLSDFAADLYYGYC